MKKHDKHHDGKKHMSSGGVTGEMMKKFGRNLARAMHQASSGKMGGSSHKSGGRGR